jgi:hypothetical protein
MTDANAANKGSIRPVKYVFLDVVKFTANRDVDEQSEIIAAVNAVVREALATFQYDSSNPNSVICIPTGDGLCIALMGDNADYDVHIQLACLIMELIDKVRSTGGPKFGVRIGVSEHTDNVVSDINERRNLAGAGINTAARVMDIGDDGHIIVSEHVHATLSVRRAYANAFRPISVEIKHGDRLNAYQLILDRAGVSRTPPVPMGSSPFFETKTQAYDLLSEKLRRKTSQYAKIDLLEFSGVTTLRLLTDIARHQRGAKVRLLLMERSAAAKFDTDSPVGHDVRIGSTIESIRLLNRDYDLSITVKYYVVPPSLSCVILDTSVLSLSWYWFYHEGDPTVLRLKGHSCVATVVEGAQCENVVRSIQRQFDRIWNAPQTLADPSFPDFASA